MPLMFRGDMKGSHWNWHVGDLVRIDAAGAGCTFIKTSVLKKLKKPWFSVDYTYNPQDPDDMSPPAAGATEDLYFYKKCRKAGFKIWADTSIQCIHEDRKNKIYYGLPGDYPQAIPGSDIKPRGKKLILDIGAGTTAPYFPEGIPVRLDNDEKVKPDILCDWNHIPEPDQKYDIIFASHALEHNSHRKTLNVLKEWLRVLKVGGEVRLLVPNLQYAAEKIYKDIPLDNADIWTLYSAQKDGGEYDIHKSGFTPNLLRGALEAVGGLEDIKVWTANGNWGNWKKWPGNYNILATAKKVKHLGADTLVDPTLKEYSPEESERLSRKHYVVGDDVIKPMFAQKRDEHMAPEAKKSYTGKKKGVKPPSGKNIADEVNSKRRKKKK
jgi:SAM-dependent methyltransferase